MTAGVAENLSCIVETAFGGVELRWNDCGLLTAIRLFQNSPGSPNRSLPDQFFSFATDVQSYFDGDLVDFRPYLNLCDFSTQTDFRRKAYAAASTIPYGKTRSYGDVARGMGSENGMRAVGGAMAANPFPIVVPCHRVVAAHGLGGFSAGCGVDMKRRMLELEGAL